MGRANKARQPLSIEHIFPRQQVMQDRPMPMGRPTWPAFGPIVQPNHLYMLLFVLSIDLLVGSTSLYFINWVMQSGSVCFIYVFNSGHQYVWFRLVLGLVLFPCKVVKPLLLGHVFENNEIEFWVLFGSSPSSLWVLSEISLPSRLEFGIRPIFPQSLHLYPCVPHISPPFSINGCIY